MRKSLGFPLILIITLNLKVTTSNGTSKFAQFYRDCNVKKFCLALPANCLENEACSMIFASSYDTSSNEALQEIIGKVDDENRYFAMGLSDDKIMGDSAVVECTLLDNKVAALRTSWNKQHSNILDLNTLEVNHIESTFENGELSCAWHRPAFTAIRFKRYDLEHNHYHLMIAKGKLRQDKIAKHNARYVTERPVNLKTFVISQADGLKEKRIERLMSSINRLEHRAILVNGARLEELQRQIEILKNTLRVLSA